MNRRHLEHTNRPHSAPLSKIPTITLSLSMISSQFSNTPQNPRKPLSTCPFPNLGHRRSGLLLVAGGSPDLFESLTSFESA